ncbi:hypothetical protein H0E87_001845, partial [Populus deltoides]
MAKSKKKSSKLRSAQCDYDFCPSHPPSAPSRTHITLGDVVQSNCEARVRTKHRKRGFQSPHPAAPPSSSSKSCVIPSTSPISIRPRCGLPAESGSLNSRCGAGNPNTGLMVGTTRSSIPPLEGTPFSGSP